MALKQVYILDHVCAFILSNYRYFDEKTYVIICLTDEDPSKQK